MKNSLYDLRHIKEYLLYGLIAGILYIIPSWIFFATAEYKNIWIIFSGSILFMFVIMLYVLKLSRRRTEYRSSWMMIIAAHFAILIGIVIAVILTLILCFSYIPGFLTGESSELMTGSSSPYNPHNTSIVTLLLVCASIGNFGAASFIAILGSYVFKLNQTKDKTAVLEDNISPR